MEEPITAPADAASDPEVGAAELSGVVVATASNVADASVETPAMVPSESLAEDTDEFPAEPPSEPSVSDSVGDSVGDLVDAASPGWEGFVEMSQERARIVKSEQDATAAAMVATFLIAFFIQLGRHGILI